MESYEERQFYELIQQPQYPALHHEEPEGRIPYGRYGYWRRKRQIRRMRKMLVMSAIAFGVIAAVTFQAVNYGAEQLLGIGNTPENTVLTIAETQGTATTGFQESTYIGYDVSDVVREAMPSIVSITGRSIQEIPSWYGYGTRSYESWSSGSGIIIGQTDEKLMIATNHHVVNGTESITIGFTNSDGSAANTDNVWDYNSSMVEAQIEGMDSENDLAVVSVALSEIPDSIRNNIKIASFGDSDSLRVGTQVVAIGNALGYGQSATSGYVSALNQRLGFGNSAAATYIQTDAAINPGNSGGALLNMQSEVIGINAAKIADDEVEGMGFAIPAHVAIPVLERLMA